MCGLLWLVTMASSLHGCAYWNVSIRSRLSCETGCPLTGTASTTTKILVLIKLLIWICYSVLLEGYRIETSGLLFIRAIMWTLRWTKASDSFFFGSWQNNGFVFSIQALTLASMARCWAWCPNLFFHMVSSNNMLVTIQKQLFKFNVVN